MDSVNLMISACAVGAIFLLTSCTSNGEELSGTLGNYELLRMPVEASAIQLGAKWDVDSQLPITDEESAKTISSRGVGKLFLQQDSSIRGQVQASILTSFFGQASGFKGEVISINATDLQTKRVSNIAYCSFDGLIVMEIVQGQTFEITLGKQEGASASLEYRQALKEQYQKILTDQGVEEIPEVSVEAGVSSGRNTSYTMKTETPLVFAVRTQYLEVQLEEQSSSIDLSSKAIGRYQKGPYNYQLIVQDREERMMMAKMRIINSNMVADKREPVVVSNADAYFTGGLSIPGKSTDVVVGDTISVYWAENLSESTVVVTRRSYRLHDSDPNVKQ